MARIRLGMVGGGNDAFIGGVLIYIFEPTRPY
mgnify:CR=1 FL=1